MVKRSVRPRRENLQNHTSCRGSKHAPVSSTKMAGPEKVQYLQTMYAWGVRFIAAIVPGRSDVKLPDDTLPGDGDRDLEGAYGWTVAAFCRSDSDECPLTLIVAISTGGGPGRAFEGECGDRAEARPALRCGGEARAGLLILSPERAVSSRCVAPRPRQVSLPTPAWWCTIGVAAGRELPIGHARKCVATTTSVFIQKKRIGRFADPLGDGTPAFPCLSLIAGSSINVFVGS